MHVLRITTTTTTKNKPEKRAKKEAQRYNNFLIKQTTANKKQ